MHWVFQFVIFQSKINNKVTPWSLANSHLALNLGKIGIVVAQFQLCITTCSNYPYRAPRTTYTVTPTDPLPMQ